jgi:hypothetical protein
MHHGSQVCFDADEGVSQLAVSDWRILGNRFWLEHVQDACTPW